MSTVINSYRCAGGSVDIKLDGKTDPLCRLNKTHSSTDR